MILASFCCLFQRDVKSLAAYSSVTHISFLLLALRLLILPGKVAGLILILAHGYTSTLMFYVIGEIYHRSSRRILYFFNRFFSSGVFFRIILLLIFLSNRGVPPSLSFLAEFIIIARGLLVRKLFFIFLFIYFLAAFYYSVFVVVCSIMGGSFINIVFNNYGLSIPLVLIIYNGF